MTITQKQAELRLKLAAATGAQAVYIAVRHDQKLREAISITHKDELRYDGKKISERDLASILVYLSGRYQIQPTRFELESGITAAAEKHPESRRRPQSFPLVTPELVTAVESWIDTNAGDYDGGFTTAIIAESVLPAMLQSNQRAAEMAIGGALRRCGWRKERKMVNCVRRYRWVPVPLQDALDGSDRDAAKIEFKDLVDDVKDEIVRESLAKRETIREAMAPPDVRDGIVREAQTGSADPLPQDPQEE